MSDSYILLIHGVITSRKLSCKQVLIKGDLEINQIAENSQYLVNITGSGKADKILMNLNKVVRFLGYDKNNYYTMFFGGVGHLFSSNGPVNTPPISEPSINTKHTKPGYKWLSDF